MTPARSTAPSPRRQRARRGEGERLRDEILAAAERLLIAGGEEAVSIRSVAEAVGITPPSIYLHFEDKNDLVFAICEKHFGAFDDYVEQAASEASDPLEELRLRGRAYVRFGLEHPEQYRILFMRKPSDTPDDFDIESLRRSTAFDHHLAAVQRAVDGRLIEGDPFLVAIALWVSVHGITSLFLSKPGFPWPADREALVDYICRVQLYGVAPRA